MKKVKPTESDIQPAAGYIHRKTEFVAVPIRITPELKESVEAASEKLGTSVNRFTESALLWYLDALKKEGSI